MNDPYLGIYRSYYGETLPTSKDIPVTKGCWGVKYEVDKDPTNYFKTKREAEKFIEKLLDHSSVQKDKIFLFKIDEVFKVKRKRLFDLIKFTGRRGRPSKR